MFVNMLASKLSKVKTCIEHTNLFSERCFKEQNVVYNIYNLVNNDQ